MTYGQAKEANTCVVIRDFGLNLIEHDVQPSKKGRYVVIRDFGLNLEMDRCGMKAKKLYLVFCFEMDFLYTYF
jgi:glycerophosphoryl diester phosphodiesterase